MRRDVLKVDCDFDNKQDLINDLQHRLSYMNDLGFFDFEKYVKKIYCVFKSSYGVKIFLKYELDEKQIVLLQLILGSDFRKEINTVINHFSLNMEYSNRLFDVKRYRDGSIKESEKEDITDNIRDYILSDKREKWKN